MNRLLKSVVLGGWLLGIILSDVSCAALASALPPPTSHYVRPATGKAPFKDRVIVFVHGIFSDADSAWASSGGAYWPMLLLGDSAFDDSDVYVANYESPVSGNTLTVDEIVAGLDNRFTDAGVFARHREVVFVCHSLGGIIVQQLLLTVREHATQVPFIYFFAVPEEGSQIANLGRWFSSDPLLETLFHGNENAYLLNLENQWKAAHFKIRRYCAYEKKPVKGTFLIVDRLSGTRNCDEVPVPINEDHFGIVKPNDTEHESYVALRNAIKANPISPKRGIAKSGAQAGTLKGVILANEAGGSPVPKVQVSAVGASLTETGEGGGFRLQFPSIQPGEVVEVTVNKPGYTVVNDVQLRVVLPKNPDAEPLILLLCKQEDREEWARRFYRLKSFDAIKETYKKRVRELEESSQQASSEMAKLRQQRDEAEAAAEKAAEELARREPGDTTNLYAEAMSLFLKGNVSEALSTLDDEKLRESVESAQKMKEQAEKTVAKSVQQYLLKATLLTTQFRFSDAERVYQAAVQAAPDSLDAHFAFAVFSQRLNHFRQARPEYLRALDIADRSGSEDDVPFILTNLGALDTAQDRLVEARQQFEEALKIRRRLVHQKPDTYSERVAETLNNLGALDRNQDRLDEARLHWEEAIKIRRQLTERSPDAYLPELAKTLDNLASLDRVQKRMGEARAHFEEALEIECQLAEQNPDVYMPDFATALNNLGNLDSELGRLSEGRYHFERALEIRRQLSKLNPDTYLPYVATTLNNLGDLDQDQSRMEEAGSHFEEALRICRQLAQQDPDAYSALVAKTLVNLGSLDAKQKSMTDARAHFEEALEIFCRLADQNRDAYLPLLATTVNNLGNLDIDQNRLADARPHFEAALRIRRQLVQQNPDAYKSDLAKTLTDLGKLDSAQNRIEEARQHLEEALGIYDELSERDAHRYDGDIVIIKGLLLVLQTIGLHYTEPDRLTDALASGHTKNRLKKKGGFSACSLRGPNFLTKGATLVPSEVPATGKPKRSTRSCTELGAGIISLHEWGYPGTSRGVAARNCRNPEVESSLLANAQTRFHCDERSGETRSEAEGNHG
jgi:tetratricopeptide (TPR) repeat protein